MWRLSRGCALLLLCALSLLSILSTVQWMSATNSGIPPRSSLVERAGFLSNVPTGLQQEEKDVVSKSKEGASWRTIKSLGREKRFEKHSFGAKTSSGSSNSSFISNNFKKSGKAVRQHNLKSSRSKDSRSSIPRLPQVIGKWRRTSFNQSHLRLVVPRLLPKRSKQHSNNATNVSSAAQKVILHQRVMKHGFKLADSVPRVMHSLLPTSTPPEQSLNFLKRKFPKIMIVGFGKAGTKALFEVLKTRPDLIGPTTETRFFSRRYSEGAFRYLQCFPWPSKNQQVIEKSPDYIIGAEVPGRLAKLAGTLNVSLSDMKFIVVLRDPIDRAVSEYLEWSLYRKSTGRARLNPFPVMALKESGEINADQPFINGSSYLPFVTRWLQFFDTSRTCFVDGDQFSQNPFYEIGLLEKCLNLTTYFKSSDFIYNNSTGFYCFRTYSKNLCMNKSKGRKHPVLPAKLKSKLIDYYRPMLNKLFQLMGRTLTWPNFQ